MLKIHHFRNATLVIETEDNVILIDPMLGKTGDVPIFSYFRFKARKNPTVPLPEACQKILSKVTHCLITHKHDDHIDKKGLQFLKDRNTPVTCSIKDEHHFRKKGLNIVQSLKYWEKTPFLGGTIEGIPARHGYKFVAKPMGNVMGFYIALPKQKSIYISSDTIYTSDVEKVLLEYQPDISIVACGTAQLDLFKPLLMTMEDIIKFVKNAPDIVIANHMEALNHCPTTRKELRTALIKNELLQKAIVPEDGEIVVFS